MNIKTNYLFVMKGIMTLIVTSMALLKDNETLPVNTEIKVNTTGKIIKHNKRIRGI